MASSPLAASKLVRLALPGGQDQMPVRRSSWLPPTGVPLCSWEAGWLR